jgi:hypothetical protein
MGLLLGGCGDGMPPSAYEHPRDRFFAAVPMAWLNEDFEPCFRTIHGVAGRLADAECYRLTEPRRMRGVAIRGFEAGSFHPGLERRPPPGERTRFRLELDPLLLPAGARTRCADGCAIRLDFVGRRTAVEGHYGHLGSAEHLIVADRVLDAKVLE